MKAPFLFVLAAGCACLGAGAAGFLETTRGTWTEATRLYDTSGALMATGTSQLTCTALPEPGAYVVTGVVQFSTDAPYTTRFEYHRSGSNAFSWVCTDSRGARLTGTLTDSGTNTIRDVCSDTNSRFTRIVTATYSSNRIDASGVFHDGAGEPYMKADSVSIRQSP